MPGKSSGLTFHYSPYAVGAYAEGSYTAFVPWRILRPYLTAEGLAIFGGDKPKDPKTQWAARLASPASAIVVNRTA